MTPAVRTKNLARLKKAGFKVAYSLPTKRGTSKLRPLAEIAGRLVALNVLYAWVAAPADAIPTKRLKAALEKGKARRWLTAEERAVVVMPRPKAHAAHVDTIGWRLENMWPLAWVLGFPAEPPFDGAMIEGETSRAIVLEFLEGAVLTPKELLAKHEARGAAEVIALEDLFYCAHNAGRSAQLGGKTVPPGFHPIAGTGVVHERRHALTWCLSPGTAWDDTDLST
jgi:hypothetical protein